LLLRKRRQEEIGMQDISSFEKPILLWHPQIHEFFGETLYFFSLRFRGYTKTILRDLQTSLGALGITGTCLYELFGAYDVLLKVWLTPVNLAKLESAFSDILELAAQPAAFRVTEMRHWAFREMPEEAILREVLRNKENILRAQEDATQKLSDRISKYQAANVLRYSPLGDNELFYTALSFGEFGSLALSTEGAIRQALFDVYERALDNTGPVRKINIYVGDGFAHALIKGCVNNVREARNFVVESIITPLKALVPETTTFAVCSTEAIECDEISEDALDKFQRGSPPLWIQDWFPDFYRLGSSDQKTMEIQSLLAVNREIVQSLSDDHKIRLIKPLLEASLTQDAGRAVVAILPWFAQIEGALGERTTWFSFMRALTKLRGVDLQKAEVEIREKVGLDKGSGKQLGKEIPLGDLLNMYLAATEQYDSGALVTGGKPQPAELTWVRNQFAHGKIFSSLDGGWKRTFYVLLWFLPLLDNLILPQIRSGEHMEG
jgi:hypothetical protein